MQSKNTLILIAGILIAGMVAALTYVGLGNGTLDSTATWTEQDESRLNEEDIPPENEGSELTENTTPQDARELLADTSSKNDVARPEILLRGRVVDTFGAAVARAEVTLEIRNRSDRKRIASRINKPVETGADGRFTFKGKGFRDLSITLIASHSNFALRILDRRFEKAEGELDIGDILLTKGATIIGSVTDLDGNGIPNAQTRLWPTGETRLAWLQDRERFLPLLDVQRDGSFRIEHVTPGQYYVEARARLKQRRWTPPLTLQDMQEELLDPIRLGPGYRIEGTVFEASTGKPIHEATVSLSGSKVKGGRAVTDERGRFEFDNLTADSVRIRVKANDFVSKDLPEVMPAEPQPLLIQLDSGLSISGIALDARTSEPVTSYNVRIKKIGNLTDSKGLLSAKTIEESIALLAQEMGLATVRLQTLRAQEKPNAEQLKLAARAVKTYRKKLELQLKAGKRLATGSKSLDPAEVHGKKGLFEKHPAGRFNSSGLDEGIYVVSIRSPDHQLHRTESLELRVGRPAPELTVQLHRGFHLHGIVRSRTSGKPIAKADIELMSVRESSPRNSNKMVIISTGPRQTITSKSDLTPVLSTRSDKQGKFELRHAPPGRYVVTARAEKYARQRGEPFELRGDREGLDLRLGALASIEGRVLGIARIREEPIQVMAFAGTRGLRTEEVGADGSYRIENLEPGAYSVRAFVGSRKEFLARELASLYAAGNSPRKFDIVLEEGEHKVFDVAIKTHPIGGIRGQVLINGQPAKGLSIYAQSQQASNPVNKSSKVNVSIRGFTGKSGVYFLSGSSRKSVTDQNGEFRFEKLSQGPYGLRVLPKSGKGIDLHREEVQVLANQDANRLIDLQIGSIAVKIAAENGDEPSELNGVAFLIRGAEPKPDLKDASRQGRTQKFNVRNGTFHSGDLPVGDYFMIVQLQGRERLEQTIFVNAGTRELNLTAPPKQAGSPTPAGTPDKGPQRRRSP